MCPDCPVILTSSGNVSAVLSINSAYKTSSLTWLGATLTLERTTGQRLIYDVDALVPLSVLRSSTSVKLNLGNLGTNIRRGTLGMSFSSGGRAWYRSNELLLTRAP